MKVIMTRLIHLMPKRHDMLFFEAYLGHSLAAPLLLYLYYIIVIDFVKSLALFTFLEVKKMREIDFYYNSEFHERKNACIICK